MRRISVYNWANLLTLLRILLAPVFITLLVYHEPGWALLAFTAASLLDLLDGMVARRLRLVTELGAWLDPAADKLLTLSAYVMLTLHGRVPLWMTMAAFTRDLLVVAGVLALAFLLNKREVRPSWWGKAATFAQMAVLALFLLVEWRGLWPAWGQVLQWILGVTVVVTLFSGLDYIVRGILKYPEQGGGKGGARPGPGGALDSQPGA